ncbi:EYxxD motif small membrane protein [Cytobacillus sp. FJAT-54145]|uniref:EYxxD motif small membrane protein n=1 Tax=Cytobacillus spartinae TaxID=3299023 RepID=A0ABW6KF26_9BACI
MDILFWEYVSDMSFILVTVIGSIVAIIYAYMRRSNKRSTR